MTNDKRFDMTPLVDCNTCQRYYQSTCDGVKLNSERKCRDYVATRQIDIENTLKLIRSILRDIDIRLNWLFFVGLFNLLLLLLNICGLV